MRTTLLTIVTIFAFGFFAAEAFAVKPAPRGPKGPPPTPPTIKTRSKVHGSGYRINENPTQEHATALLRPSIRYFAASGSRNTLARDLQHKYDGYRVYYKLYPPVYTHSPYAFLRRTDYDDKANFRMQEGNRQLPMKLLPGG